MNTRQMQAVKVALSEMNINELRQVSEYVHMMYKIQQQRAVSVFSKGDKVSFVTRSGEKVVGLVAKVNQKTVTVSTPVGQYKVSGSLLKAA